MCATDPDEGGVISPGGVGYDINCGVRLMRSDLFLKDVQPQLRDLVDKVREKAVAAENYESAAALRDQIKRLEHEKAT